MPNPYTLEDIGGLGEGSIFKAFFIDVLSHADYIISSPDGTTVNAQSMTERASFSHASDAGNVTQQAINALGAAGGTIVLAGNLAWGSVPALPRSVTGKLRIVGAGCKVTLSAGGSRLFDFNRVADQDTFQNIEITDLTVDANNIDGTTHVILGTRVVAGTTDMRCNYQYITVRRVRAINIPTAQSRNGISIGLRQQAGGEGTLNYAKDLLFEDIHVEGGLSAITVTGADMSGGTTTTNLNMLIDNVRLVRCKHIQPSGSLLPSLSSNFQIGQNSPVGYVLLRDCYGENSIDTGIEIDNATKADIEDCEQVNCRFAFYTTNFAPPPAPNAQSINFRRCKATVTNANVNAQPSGFNSQASNSLTIGNILYEGCVYEQSNNVLSTTLAPRVFMFGPIASTIRKVTIRDCKVDITSLNWNNAANSEPIRVTHVQGATVGKLEIKGLDSRINGTISGAGKLLSRVINIESGAMQLDIDGVDIDTNISGQGAATQTYGLWIVPGSAATVGGSIKRVKFIALGSDTNSIGMRFGSTTNLTISPAPIVVEDCDFTAISGSSEFNVDATQSALGAIVTRGNRWKTKPVPVGLTGLVTATGKRLGAQSAAVIWPAVVQFIQGSGAAITAIDYSTNDGTTYTNLVTQASAALPAGAGPEIGPLNPADLVKVTFTTTQPTTTLVPVNP